MTVWYAQNSSVNIDSANLWNDAPAGGGNWLTWANLANGDRLEANGKSSISINVDVGSPGVRVTLTTASGGGFTLSTAAANRTTYCYVSAGTTTALLWTGGSYRWTSVGNITGGSSASARGVSSNSGTNNLTHIGNLAGGSASGTQGMYLNGGSGTSTITGNATGGSGGDSIGFYCEIGGVSLIGDAIASSSAPGVYWTASAVFSHNGRNLFASNGTPGVAMYRTSKYLWTGNGQAGTLYASVGGVARPIVAASVLLNPGLSGGLR